MPAMTSKTLHNVFNVCVTLFGGIVLAAVVVGQLIPSVADSLR